MILSMTGYGNASKKYKNKTYSFEIKSLNSKFSDIRIKLPSELRDKEPEVRSLVSKIAMRGKIDVILESKGANSNENYVLNDGLFKQYHAQLKKIADELQLDNSDIMQSIMRLPNVLTVQEESFDAEEWNFICELIEEAINKFDEFRASEGKVLHQTLTENVNKIHSLLKSVDPFEKERITKTKARMQANLDEFLGKENVDKNRFEQEVLFYIEKIDISEEKVRLDQHCKYFLEELNDSKLQKGKKLSFICQEMGREINTLGSKAYSSDLQKIVINMKDELEKIKEQVANTL